jgi:hypothetical protein
MPISSCAAARRFEYVSLREAEISGEQAQALTVEAIGALPKIQNKLQEARRQLRHYRTTLQQKYGTQLRLRCYAVVALGFERLLWEEVQ